VVAALRLLGLGRAGFGILPAAAGAGALGSIPLSTLLVGQRRLGWWLAAGLMASGLSIAAIGASASGIAAVALMVGWCLRMGLADVAGQALLNRVVPAAAIARVTGMMESGKLLFEGGGSLAAPLLVTLMGIRGGLIAAGAAVALLVAAGARGFPALDRRAVDRVAVIELLARVSVFRRLAVDALEGVGAQLTRLSVPAGREVITQGDRSGTRWYLVERGELEVVIDGYLVNELGDGDGFGELALLRDVPRWATVRARGEVALLSLERDAFLEAVAGRACSLSGQVERPGARRQETPTCSGGRCCCGGSSAACSNSWRAAPSGTASPPGARSSPRVSERTATTCWSAAAPWCSWARSGARWCCPATASARSPCSTTCRARRAWWPRRPASC
jgi:hypothetical protein